MELQTVTPDEVDNFISITVLRTLTEITLLCARAPEAAENGLRLEALGNLISITVITTGLGSTQK